MNNQKIMNDIPEISFEVPELKEIQELSEVKVQMDFLPDGREAIIIGDPEGCRQLNHRQGDNPFGFQGTCGLVACEQILNQFGLKVSETDITAHALQRGQCCVGQEPGFSGGTTAYSQSQILSDYGVPAHVENLSDLESLSFMVEQGHGIIAEVNAGVLWNDARAWDNGGMNHAIVITGVARNPDSGNIEGFFINDSGRSSLVDSARFVDSSTMQACWLGTGGNCVVTDLIK